MLTLAHFARSLTTRFPLRAQRRLRRTLQERHLARAPYYRASLLSPYVAFALDFTCVEVSTSPQDFLATDSGRRTLTASRNFSRSLMRLITLICRLANFSWLLGFRETMARPSCEDLVDEVCPLSPENRKARAELTTLAPCRSSDRPYSLGCDAPVAECLISTKCVTKLICGKVGTSARKK